MSAIVGNWQASGTIGYNSGIYFLATLSEPDKKLPGKSRGVSSGPDGHLRQSGKNNLQAPNYFDIDVALS
jgi:hypothetical protein